MGQTRGSFPQRLQRTMRQCAPLPAVEQASIGATLPTSVYWNCPDCQVGLGQLSEKLCVRLASFRAWYSIIFDLAGSACPWVSCTVPMCKLLFASPLHLHALTWMHKFTLHDMENDCAYLSRQFSTRILQWFVIDFFFWMTRRRLTRRSMRQGVSSNSLSCTQRINVVQSTFVGSDWLLTFSALPLSFL
jgi:hypothetical protein